MESKGKVLAMVGVDVAWCKQSNGGDHRLDVKPIPVLGPLAVHGNGKPTGGRGKGASDCRYASAAMLLRVELFDLVSICVNVG